MAQRSTSSPSSTSGFGQSDAPVVSDSGFFENAINLNDLKTIKLDDPRIDLPTTPYIQEDELATLMEQFAPENPLPVGQFFEGERLDKFTLHPYTTRFDRILGQMLKNSRNRLIPVLAQFIPQIVNSIGGFEVKDLAAKFSKSPNRLIEDFFLGDVLTILLCARCDAQGRDIAIAATCPNCGAKNDDDPKKGRPYHDLSTVKVRTFKNLASKLVVEVPLVDGMTIGSERITKIYMQPLRLYQAEKIANADTAPEDVSMLYSMVVGVPEVEAYRHVRGNVFGDELYDRLSRNDLKVIRKALRILQPGPDMTIDMICYRCGNEWQEGIAWGRIRDFLYVAPATDDD
jgi:hypothetical protein